MQPSKQNAISRLCVNQHRHSVFHDLDDANEDCLFFDQDHHIIGYNDVEKDVVKLIPQHSKTHQFAFLFLKDFEIFFFFRTPLQYLLQYDS